MKKTKLLKTMVTLAMSAAMLLSATLAFAETKQTTENGVAVTAEADENGFVIENGVLTEYTGTAAEVVIPDGVTSIGDYAFLRNMSLKEVTIPAGVTNIGERAFSECRSLEKVTIPASVTSIANSAFLDCSSLTEVTIPASVTEIGSAAFWNTKWLENKQKENPLVIVNHILIDGQTCSGNVEIPDGVTSISGAFLWCNSLTGVTIPASVTSIMNAFGGCSSLTDINVSSGNSTYASMDGCLYTKDKTELLVWPGGKTKAEIPEGVTSIGANAFLWCSSLTEVTIPGSVTSIGEAAFMDCSSLTEVTIPGSVVNIGSGAFDGCSSLKEVVIPASVTSIGEDVFGGCDSLEKVTIPGSVTSIGNYAFSYCSSLTEVTIPASVTSIGVEAFAECRSLEKVTIPASVTNIGEYAFWRCANLTIYGIAGSYAETYARENDIPFIALSGSSSAIDKESTNSTYTKGSSEGATIKCFWNLADFLNVYVDGTLIDKANYTLKEGSTIITFTQAFMDSLSAGEHIFTLEYTGDRKVDVSMTIAEADETTGNSQQSADASGVKTGDTNNMVLWITLAFASAGCVLAVRKKVQIS